MFKKLLFGLILALGVSAPSWAGSAHYTTSTTYESNHVIETTCSSSAPCYLYGYTALNHSGTAALLMIFDATSAPANGAVTPKICVPMSASTTGADGGASQPVQPGFQLPFTTGITMVESSSGTCASLTASTNGWFESWTSPS